MNSLKKHYFYIYQRHQQSKGLIELDPTYVIDPTESETRLIIQRVYDVERDVRHLSSRELKYLEIVNLRSQELGRHFYYGSPLLEEGVPATIEDEAFEVLFRLSHRIGDDTYSNDWNWMYCDDNPLANNWLPKSIRSLHSRLIVLARGTAQARHGIRVRDNLLDVNPEYAGNGMRTAHKAWADGQEALDLFPIEMKVVHKEDWQLRYNEWFNFDQPWRDGRLLQEGVEDLLDSFMNEYRDNKRIRIHRDPSSPEEPISSVPLDDREEEMAGFQEEESLDDLSEDNEEAEDESEEEWESDWEEYEPNDLEPEEGILPAEEEIEARDPHEFPGGPLTENYSNIFAREEPYKPTFQEGRITKFNKERGNPPAG